MLCQNSGITFTDKETANSASIVSKKKMADYLN